VLLGRYVIGMLDLAKTCQRSNRSLINSDGILQLQHLLPGLKFNIYQCSGSIKAVRKYVFDRNLGLAKGS